MTADPEEVDLSQMSEAQLLADAKQAHSELSNARTRPLARLGRRCARLHELGWTWEKIGAEMGVNLTTAYRWARPYLPQ